MQMSRLKREGERVFQAEGTTEAELGVSAGLKEGQRGWRLVGEGDRCPGSLRSRQASNQV